MKEIQHKTSNPEGADNHGNKDRSSAEDKKPNENKSPDSLIAHHYHIINSKGFDWSPYIEKHQLVKSDDPIAHYILNWQDYPLIIPDVFDSTFYLKHYQDIRESGENPLVHFIEHGEAEGRAPYPSSKFNEVIVERKTSDSDINLLIKSCQINWDEYKKTYCPDTDGHPVDHYLQHWKILMPVFPGFFDPWIYYELYPDIKKYQIDPLLHYIKHGISENRIGWLDNEDYFEAGSIKFNDQLKTIIICAHETSYTGAPIVALEIARRLNDSYNIVTVGLKKSRMHDSFLKAAFLHINTPNNSYSEDIKKPLALLLKDYKIEATVLSSAETLHFLDAAAFFEIPTISLIHEYSDYTIPYGKVSHAIYASDVVIYPAESVKLSGLNELKETTGLQTEPNHIIIKPQGGMLFDTSLEKNAPEVSLKESLNIPKDGIVIAAAGHIQQRKGVDWFFETCYYLLKRMQSEPDARADLLHFVWIGDGFSPEDLVVSVWLSAFIKRVGIESRCYFSGHVDCVTEALKEVDVYLLTSRLDPFPNVAIDALSADCSIGCFESASGIADFLSEHNSRSVVAPYGDRHALADLIFENFEQLIERNGVNSSLCETQLCFNDYVETIKSAIETAVRKKTEIYDVIANNTEFESLFDAEFYGMSFCGGDKRYHFLSLLHKGIILSRPYLGSYTQNKFNVYNYSNKDSFSNYVTSLLLNSNINEPPVLMLTGETRRMFTGKIAIHLHVFYREMIPEFAIFFKHLEDHDVDLYVTHNESLNEEEKELLRNSISGRLFLELVDNCGRDVYPFHKLYCEYFSNNYEVIGHFHTKKTVDFDEGLGNRWRHYLLNNLIGNKKIANQILSIFNEPSINLVYAYDRHSVDEGDNIKYIDYLLSEMNIESQNQYYSFPLGTMFWARTSGLNPLLKIDQSTFKVYEPVPYDGTVLHAFERILPLISKSTGKKAQMVYLSGTDW